MNDDRHIGHSIGIEASPPIHIYSILIRDLFIRFRREWKEIEKEEKERKRKERERSEGEKEEKRRRGN